jgi:integrase
MATLSYSLSKKADKATGKHEILARFVVGSRINQRAKTGVYAPADYWNDSSQAVDIPSWRMMNAERKKLVETLNGINTRIQGMRAAVMESFIQAGAGKQPLPAGWLASTIDRYNHPELFEDKPKALYLSDGFEDYLQHNKISNQRDKNTRVVLRSLLRFEAYTGGRLELDTLTADDIRAFEGYIRREGEIVEQHPELLKVCQESRIIESRSENTIIGRLKILRAVVLWNVANGHTDNNPFARYSIGECVYGTPYYITIQERERLFHTDLSSQPQLAIQRDIFVFQCLVGCRVSDLLKLTRSNLINGAIEYIPQKTKDERPATVRVPLNRTAAGIVEKYADERREALLPFVSAQKYNQAIKRIFLAARLTRPVTVLDPLSRQEIQRPLNEIASSHLARRTFVGNLYKQVKDPNLIAKLSGHTEGSRAFARYRDIDEDMRKDLVNLLEDGE